MKDLSQVFVGWDQGFRWFGAAVLIVVPVEVPVAVVSAVVRSGIVLSDAWSTSGAVGCLGSTDGGHRMFQG